MGAGDGIVTCSDLYCDHELSECSFDLCRAGARRILFLLRRWVFVFPIFQLCEFYSFDWATSRFVSCRAIFRLSREA